MREVEREKYVLFSQNIKEGEQDNKSFILFSIPGAKLKLINMALVMCIHMLTHIVNFECVLVYSMVMTYVIWKGSMTEYNRLMCLGSCLFPYLMMLLFYVFGLGYPEIINVIVMSSVVYGQDNANVQNMTKLMQICYFIISLYLGHNVSVWLRIILPQLAFMFILLAYSETLQQSWYECTSQEVRKLQVFVKEVVSLNMMGMLVYLMNMWVMCIMSVLLSMVIVFVVYVYDDHLIGRWRPQWMLRVSYINVIVQNVSSCFHCYQNQRQFWFFCLETESQNRMHIHVCKRCCTKLIVGEQLQICGCCRRKCGQLLVDLYI